MGKKKKGNILIRGAKYGVRTIARLSPTGRALDNHLQKRKKQKEQTNLSRRKQ